MVGPCAEATYGNEAWDIRFIDHNGEAGVLRTICVAHGSQTYNNDLCSVNKVWELNSGPRSPWKVRYFLDTEFTDFQSSQLISLAIVGEDGREFYAECSNFNLALCSDFVRDAVLPHLGVVPGRAMPSADVRKQLQAWLAAVPLKPKPALCYDYERDLTLVERLLGTALPRGWQVEDVGKRIDAACRNAYLDQRGVRHHALHDARANAIAFR